MAVFVETHDFFYEYSYKNTVELTIVILAKWLLLLLSEPWIWG